MFPAMTDFFSFGSTRCAIVFNKKGSANLEIARKVSDGSLSIGARTVLGIMRKGLLRNHCVVEV